MVRRLIHNIAYEGGRKLPVVTRRGVAVYRPGMDRNRQQLDELLTMVADDPVATARIKEAWRDIEHWVCFLADRGFQVSISFDHAAGRFIVDTTTGKNH